MLLVFIFLCEIFIFALLIKQFVHLKELYKIGTFNLILISAYIVINIVYFINELGYLSTISSAIALLILYRLVNINIIIDYSLKNGEKVFCYFHQRDKRWKKIKYGTSTLGRNGCGVAVLAMIHSILDININPEEAGRWISENFNIKIGTPMDIAVKYLDNIGIKSTYLPKNIDIASEVKNNTVICVLVRNNFAYINKLIGRAENHLILLYDIHDNKAYIADPDDYAKTIRPMHLAKLIKKVNKSSPGITHPYISVHL